MKSIIILPLGRLTRRMFFIICEIFLPSVLGQPPRDNISKYCWIYAAQGEFSLLNIAHKPYINISLPPAVLPIRRSLTTLFPPDSAYRNKFGTKKRPKSTEIFKYLEMQCIKRVSVGARCAIGSIKDMTKNTYLTLRPEEKDIIHECKAEDPRFTGDSRIADGAYVALALREYMENLTDAEGHE